MARRDVHRPSAINPQDYQYVAFECVPPSGEPLGDAMFQLSERAKIRAHMGRTGGTYSTHAHGGNCMVCGNAQAIYTVLFHHEPTNTYVRMGQDCAEKVDAQYPRDAFVSFKRNADEERRARAGKAKAARYLADHGLSQAWEIQGQGTEEATIRDIVSRLVRFGSITEKQVGFIRFLLNKVNNREQVAAARAAEHEAAAPVPVTEERVLIEGEVLSSKVKDTPFGRVRKLLVKTDAGWKAYGTSPSVLGAVERGERVKLMARIEPAKDDPKMGWWSRPTVAA